jgi:hypothetical protein
LFYRFFHVRKKYFGKLKKKGAPFKSGTDGLFGGKEGQGIPFLISVENTGW